MQTSQHLIDRNLSRAYVLSHVVALLLAAASLAGLFIPANLYPTEELRRAFLANDVVNLLIGLPVLLGSLWAARRGSLLGLLFWPGALFYVTYNSIAYTIAMPFTVAFVVNLTLVILSFFALFGLLSSLDGAVVQAQITGKMPERYIAGTMIGFGVLFFLMAVGKVVSFATGQAAISWGEVSVQIADLLITPCWVIGGILLWLKQPFGYLSAAGLLFQASMLFVGLLIFFILQPFVTGVPFSVGDFVVIAVMSLFCFIPFGLFVRGMLKQI
jgi:hypothetical protein